MKIRKKEFSPLAVAAVVIISILVAGCVSPAQQPDAQAQLKTFASEEEVKQFLQEKQETGFGGFGGAMLSGEAALMRSTADVATGAPQASGNEKANADDYSVTNVQVEGVDEADYVKNDGKYIYTLSGDQIIIVDAFPAESAKIVSTINLSNSNPQQLYVNGNRLVVFGNVYNYYGYPMPLAAEEVVTAGGSAGSGVAGTETAEGSVGIAEAKIDSSASIRMPPIYNEPTTYIRIYDITDRSNPVIKKDLVFNGTYYDSRMIGGYVYAIFTAYPQYNDGGIIIPRFSPDQVVFPEVSYFDVPGYSYQFTNVVSVNVNDNNQEIENKVFLTSYSTNLFVSEKNIYLVYQKQMDYRVMYYDILDEAIIPQLPSNVRSDIEQIRSSDKSENRKYGEIQLAVQEYIESIGPEEGAAFYKNVQEKTEKLQARLAKEYEKSFIHKISIDNGKIEYKTKGEVPGYPLNQFSMDENNGYFRIATTTNQWSETSLNHLYVLDEGMNKAGKIEDFAKGEHIFSARFIGDRAYLVTFVRVDPLFVIDLSDPTNPKILGELKIPGVSDYLHPYDENHIIGIGRSADDSQGRVLFAGIKLSLFDVSDVENPMEVAKYEIGDRGTSSEALYDHRAFLFNREKNLLVMPVMLVENKNNDPNLWWGQPTWQGAYVFSLTPETGFELKGRVTHSDLANSTDMYYYYGPYSITRSLYMDNVLYTLSQKAIMANDLNSMEEISTVDLPGYNYGYGPFM